MGIPAKSFKLSSRKLATQHRGNCRSTGEWVRPIRKYFPDEVPSGNIAPYEPDVVVLLEPLH